MKIRSLTCSRKEVEIVLNSDPGHRWKILLGNVHDLLRGLDRILMGYGIVGQYPGGFNGNVTKEELERLQITELESVDFSEWADEIEARRADGGFVVGGMWAVELTVNGAVNSMTFNHVEEFLQYVWQIHRRESSNVHVQPALFLDKRKGA